MSTGPERTPSVLERTLRRINTTGTLLEAVERCPRQTERHKERASVVDKKEDTERQSRINILRAKSLNSVHSSSTDSETGQSRTLELFSVPVHSIPVTFQHPSNGIVPFIQAWPGPYRNLRASLMTNDPASPWIVDKLCHMPWSLQNWILIYKNFRFICSQCNRHVHLSEPSVCDYVQVTDLNGREFTVATRHALLSEHKNLLSSIRNHKRSTRAPSELEHVAPVCAHPALETVNKTEAMLEIIPVAFIENEEINETQTSTPVVDFNARRIRPFIRLHSKPLHHVFYKTAQDTLLHFSRHGVPTGSQLHLFEATDALVQTGIATEQECVVDARALYSKYIDNVFTQEEKRLLRASSVRDVADGDTDTFVPFVIIPRMQIVSSYIK